MVTAEQWLDLITSGGKRLDRDTCSGPLYVCYTALGLCFCLLDVPARERDGYIYIGKWETQGELCLLLGAGFTNARHSSNLQLAKTFTTNP